MSHSLVELDDLLAARLDQARARRSPWTGRRYVHLPMKGITIGGRTWRPPVAVGTKECGFTIRQVKQMRTALGPLLWEHAQRLEAELEAFARTVR